MCTYMYVHTPTYTGDMYARAYKLFYAKCTYTYTHLHTPPPCASCIYAYVGGVHTRPYSCFARVCPCIYTFGVPASTSLYVYTDVHISVYYQ